MPGGAQRPPQHQHQQLQYGSSPALQPLPQPGQRYGQVASSSNIAAATSPRQPPNLAAAVAAPAAAPATMVVRLPERIDLADLVQRVVQLLLDSARSRSDALLDLEAEERGLADAAGGMGVGGAGGSPNDAGRDAMAHADHHHHHQPGYHHHGHGHAAEGPGPGGMAMAVEAAAVVGTLLAACRLLDAAMCASAEAAPLAAETAEGGGGGAEDVSSGAWRQAAPAHSPQHSLLTAHARTLLATLDDKLHGGLEQVRHVHCTDEGQTGLRGRGGKEASAMAAAFGSFAGNIVLHALPCGCVCGDAVAVPAAPCSNGQVVVCADGKGGRKLGHAQSALHASPCPALSPIPPLLTVSTASCFVPPSCPPPLSRQLLSGRHPVPRAPDALLDTAVRYSRAAAGEELLGNCRGAIEQYARAADLLLFLLAPTMPTANDPADDGPSGGAAGERGPEAAAAAALMRVRPRLPQPEHQRLCKYYAAVRLRQSACMSALNAGQAGGTTTMMGGR